LGGDYLEGRADETKPNYHRKRRGGATAGCRSEQKGSKRVGRDPPVRAGNVDKFSTQKSEIRVKERKTRAKRIKGEKKARPFFCFHLRGKGQA